MIPASSIAFGLFALALGVPGLWTGWRHGRVKFKGQTYWRNEDRRGFWESEISNIVAVLVGIGSLAYAVHNL